MVVAPFFTSLGTLPALRVQNQTLMNASVRSIAYHPPPALLKAGPKLFDGVAFTPHPALLFTFASQFVCAAALEPTIKRGKEVSGEFAEAARTRTPSSSVRCWAWCTLQIHEIFIVSRLFNACCAGGERTGTCVEGGLVGGNVVDAFYDVDLALIRPISSYFPYGRPSSK